MAKTIENFLDNLEASFREYDMATIFNTVEATKSFDLDVIANLVHTALYVLQRNHPRVMASCDDPSQPTKDELDVLVTLGAFTRKLRPEKAEPRLFITLVEVKYLLHYIHSKRDFILTKNAIPLSTDHSKAMFS
jgi:hypothetical protein